MKTQTRILLALVMLPLVVALGYLRFQNDQRQDEEFRKRVTEALAKIKGKQ